VILLGVQIPDAAAQPTYRKDTPKSGSPKSRRQVFLLPIDEPATLTSDVAGRQAYAIAYTVGAVSIG